MKYIVFLLSVYSFSLNAQNHDVQCYIDYYDVLYSTTWDWKLYQAPDTMYINCHFVYEDSSIFYEYFGFGDSGSLHILNTNQSEGYSFNYSLEILCSNDYDELDGYFDHFFSWCDCDGCHTAKYSIWENSWNSDSKYLSPSDDCKFSLDYGGNYGTEVDFETQIKVKVYSSDDDTQVFDELVLVFYLGDNSCDSPTENENNFMEEHISLQYLAGEKIIQYSKMTAINGMQYRLINQMGMVVQIGNLDNVEGVIDVSECHAGWYLVEVVDGHGQNQKMQKFVIY